MFGGEWSPRLTRSFGKCGEEGNEAADGAITRCITAIGCHSRIGLRGRSCIAYPSR